MKDAAPKIHRSYKLKLPERSKPIRCGRFSKIRNFTIGTPRESRLKVRDVAPCLTFGKFQMPSLFSGGCWKFVWERSS